MTERLWAYVGILSTSTSPNTWDNSHQIFADWLRREGTGSDQTRGAEHIKPMVSPTPRNKYPVEYFPPPCTGPVQKPDSASTEKKACLLILNDDWSLPLEPVHSLGTWNGDEKAKAEHWPPPSPTSLYNTSPLVLKNFLQSLKDNKVRVWSLIQSVRG